MEVCNCSMFCCTLLYVHSSIAIILMGKRELVALLNLSSWCLLMVERLFLAVPRGYLRIVIVVFPDHTHLLFFIIQHNKSVVHNGQQKHSDLSASIINIQLNINQLYRKDTKAQRKRNSIALVVARSQLHRHQR